MVSFSFSMAHGYHCLMFSLAALAMIVVEVFYKTLGLVILLLGSNAILSTLLHTFEIEIFICLEDPTGMAQKGRVVWPDGFGEEEFESGKDEQ